MRILAAALLVISTFKIPTIGSATPQSGWPKMTVIDWARPQSGWLYVVDSNGNDKHGKIFLIDPVAGSIRGSIQTGYDPDIAVSKDGSKLFLVQNHELLILDATTATMLRTAPIKELSRYIAIPGFSPVVSEDGKLLYVEIQHHGAGGCKTGVSAIDIESGHLFEAITLLPNCLGWNLQSWSVGAVLNSAESDEIHIVGPMDDHADGHQFFNLNSRTRMSGGLLYGRDTMIFISGGGTLSYVNLRTHQIERIVPVTSGHNIRYSSIAAGKIFLSVEAAAGKPKSVLMIDVQSATLLGSIASDEPFWITTPSVDGSTLYAPTVEGRSVLVFNTKTKELTKAIRNVGTMPGRIVIAP
jgi:DNA-binding beta-propeller fold protein YncE